MKARLLCIAALLAIPALVNCSSEEGDAGGDSADVTSDKQLFGNDLPDKTISLTFDDGPGRRTAELADFLADKGIKGTFFINGMQVPGKQKAIDQVVGRGHLLANHTQNHKQLTKLSGAQIVEEVSATDAIIAKAQPNGPWLVRAPFGAWNPSVANALNNSPMKKYVGSVFWDEGGQLTANAAADWDCWGKKVSVERCGELYMQEIRTKRRGIVLMHDIHDRTVDMVKMIVPKLMAEGFKFVGTDAAPAVKRAIDADRGTVAAVSTVNEGELVSQAPVLAKVGQCAETTIVKLSGRFEGETTFESGMAVEYANGLFTITSEKDEAAAKSVAGDPVTLCLDSIPKDCPPGDDRGKVYTATNKRTNVSWTMPDSSHMCGGA